MSYLVLKDRKSSQLIPTRVYQDPRIAQAILQPTRWKILNLLITRGSCAKELAETLRTSEQVICYHLKALEKAEFIRLERTEKKRGAVAKYYRADQRALTVLANATPLEAVKVGYQRSAPDLAARVLGPFVAEGRFNGHIVIGSPEPHGIFRAATKGGEKAVDLGLFLGSLLPLTRECLVRLDTEITQQELLRNLILIGSPRVNTVTMTVNEWLPITYEQTGEDLMLSTITNNSYSGDEGAIQLIPNPLERNSHVLVIAGNNELGTRTAVLAIIKYAEEVAKGNSANKDAIARVVNGLDMDNDGVVDDVEFLE